MQKLAFILSTFLVGVYLTGCTPSTPSRGINTNTPTPTVSAEAEAKRQTEQMRTSLNLTNEQTEKVMILNTTHLKLVKYLRSNGEEEKIEAAKENYVKEMKVILSDAQFMKFKAEFGF